MREPENNAASIFWGSPALDSESDSMMEVEPTERTKSDSSTIVFDIATELTRVPVTKELTRQDILAMNLNTSEQVALLAAYYEAHLTKFQQLDLMQSGTPEALQMWQDMNEVLPYSLKTLQRYANQNELTWSDLLSLTDTVATYRTNMPTVLRAIRHPEINPDNVHNLFEARSIINANNPAAIRDGRFVSRGKERHYTAAIAQLVRAISQFDDVTPDSDILVEFAQAAHGLFQAGSVWQSIESAVKHGKQYEIYDTGYLFDHYSNLVFGDRTSVGSDEFEYVDFQQLVERDTINPLGYNRAAPGSYRTKPASGSVDDSSESRADSALPEELRSTDDDWLD